ncbi:MAG: hypothetical protein LBE78_01285 [Burkholderiaceae bacterium]|nr:hypothetical protein [Burkholderiaceae bacterium]
MTQTAMKNALVKILTAFILFHFSHAAFALDPLNAAMKSILVDFKKTASESHFQQIEDAISSSEALQRDLNEMAADKQFTGFLILPRTQLTDEKAEFFGGYVQGTKIALATEYLEKLKNNRPFHAAQPDDIPPNNTVFVISHLLYHIKNPLDFKKYPSKNEFVEAALKTEALAFIQAWNTMLQVAQRSNDAKPLSTQQFGQLLLNTRYRFVLTGAMKQDAHPLKFSQSGSVEANDVNIQAIIETLKKSSHADLE